MGKINFKIGKSIVEILCTILLFPIVLIIILWALMFTPIDYIRYKKTQYYNDTKEKYSWFCMSSYYVKLYNLVKKEELPFDYYRSNERNITGYGFFVYKDTLILIDYEPWYDQDLKMWVVDIDDEYINIEDEIENDIERCNCLLKNNICKQAVVLVDKELLVDHQVIKNKNYVFLPVNDCFDVEALKSII